MRYSKVNRIMAKAVLRTWMRGRPQEITGDCNFVSCRHCEQAGIVRVQHDDDCPVVISRRILKGKKL